MSGGLTLTECWHYFAGKQIDALIRIHIAENDCKERNPFGHALAQPVDYLRRSTFDTCSPERQPLSDLPLFLNFILISADAHQKLLGDINLVNISSHRLAVMFENIELVFEVAVPRRAIPTICVLGNYPQHHLLTAAADRNRRMRFLEGFGIAI